MAIFAARANGEFRLDVTPTVTQPRRFAHARAPSTYGVVPLAAIPTTTSPRFAPALANSRAPFDTESSAPSTAPRSAFAPPAINACTSFGDMPYVGGHSAASSTASRPLVPAPT